MPFSASRSDYSDSLFSLREDPGAMGHPQVWPVPLPEARMLHERRAPLPFASSRPGAPAERAAQCAGSAVGTI